MKCRLNILIYIFITFIYSSCSDNVVNNNLSTPIESENNFKYPDKVNSFWYYTTRNFVTNLRPDSIRIYYPTDTLIGYGGATVLSDTVINNDTLVLLQNNHGSAGHNHTTLEFYKQSDSGLIRIAYYSDGTNFGPYRPGLNSLHYTINDKSFNSIDELMNYYNNDFDKPASDTTIIYFDDPPIRALKYPITENTEWGFVTYGTTRITKKYTNFETVNLIMGSFHCIKVQRNWYYNSPVSDPRFISFDYFSKDGMVKRDFTIKDVLVSNNLGIQIGYIDVKEEDNLNLFTHP